MRRRRPSPPRRGAVRLQPFPRLRSPSQGRRPPLRRLRGWPAMTATADRFEPGRSREELRLAQVASGLLMLLDAHRLTGRLPLEVQVQASRLRHAVKLVIQAEAARSPVPVPASPAAQGLDPAAA